MKDSTLLSIAITVSIIGILSLYFISESVEIEEIDSRRIADHEDETIKIFGIVEDSTVTESATFIKVRQPNTVNIVVFEPLVIAKGSSVEVTGKVDEYSNRYNILADRIRVR